MSTAFAVVAATTLAGCSTGKPNPEQAPGGLIGRIYDVASDSFISEQELAARLVGPRFVLLGASGRVSPYPLAITRSGVTPRFTR